MFTFALKRVLQAVPTIVGAATLVFFMIRLAPGDPVDYMVGEANASIPAEMMQILRARYGLDQPLFRQYGLFITDAVRGDLGISITHMRPVISVIAPQIRPTIQLAVAGMLIAIVLGVPMGILAAVHRNTGTDHAVMGFAVLWVSMPSFWFAILLIYIFGFVLPIFPMFGSGRGGLLEQARYLVLPSIAIGARSMGILARMSRSYMLEVLSQDFVRTARAKGVRESAIRLKHALRNIAIPITTLIGLDLAYLVTGTVVIETVFARAGLGKLMIDSILFRDYPVVQGCIMLFALLVLFVNLVTDALYGLIDPRVRYV